MLYPRILGRLLRKLEEAGVPNAAFDARRLLEQAYGKSSAELLAELETEMR